MQPEDSDQDEINRFTSMSYKEKNKCGKKF